MSTFMSLLHQLTAEAPTEAGDRPGGGGGGRRGSGPFPPTPVDMAGLFGLLQDQMATLAADAPTATNQAFLRSLMADLERDVGAPPARVPGVTQEWLDALDRVPRARLRPDDACPVCAERFLADKYCLVVQLPCHPTHRFDLECVSAWLLSKGTCPLCRTEMMARKKPVDVPPAEDEDEEEQDLVDGLYG